MVPSTIPPAGTPRQNGVAERMNQTLAIPATAMLIDSGIPKSFWSDAMHTAAFLTARNPSSGLKGKTPYGKIFKRKVDASWFRPFGCPAYALIPKGTQSWKFAHKGRKSIMIGYTTGKKAYRLLDTVMRKVGSRQTRHDGYGTTLYLPSLGARGVDSRALWENSQRRPKKWLFSR